MMFSSQFDGGNGFMSSQSTQSPENAASKSRSGGPGVFPVTVKQIKDSLESSDDKTVMSIDGVDTTNIRLVGLVMNKVERATDVSFMLDDGTGQIKVIRWVNESSDANETAVIQNGIYVTVIGSLRGFQDKKRAVAFSVRPVEDYNAITHHFVQCTYVHLKNTKGKGGFTQSQTQPTITSTNYANDVKPEQTPVSSQSDAGATEHGSETDIYKLVLNVLMEISTPDNDHGMHIDEVTKRLGLPLNKIKEAIDYHVDMGNVYSTIDDFHFKATFVSDI